MGRESRGERAQRQLTDLRVAGFSDAQIASRLGVNRSTVFRWRTGASQPRKGGRGRKLTYLYKKVESVGDLVLGEGGTVDLTDLFRRVWLDRGEPQFPLALSAIPQYKFPTNSPVWVVVNFSEWVLQSGEVVNDMRIRANLRPSDDIESVITENFEGALDKWANYPPEYARMENVILRRGQNVV